MALMCVIKSALGANPGPLFSRHNLQIRKLIKFTSKWTHALCFEPRSIQILHQLIPQLVL